MNHDRHHDDFGGLHRDLRSIGARMDRRHMLRLAGRFGAGAGVLQLLGCSDTPTSPTSTTTIPTTTTPTTTTTSPTTNATCSRVPQETAGPFPGDGSNGPTVLSSTGVVRNDIRSSFAGMSGTAAGVPLTIQLTIVSATTCSPLAGRASHLAVRSRRAAFV